MSVVCTALYEPSVWLSVVCTALYECGLYSPIWALCVTECGLYSPIWALCVTECGLYSPIWVWSVQPYMSVVCTALYEPSVWLSVVCTALYECVCVQLAKAAKSGTPLPPRRSQEPPDEPKLPQSTTTSFEEVVIHDIATNPIQEVNYKEKMYIQVRHRLRRSSRRRSSAKFRN